MATLLVFAAVCTGCENLKTPEPKAGSSAIRLATSLPGATRSSVTGFKGEILAFAVGKSSGTYNEIWEARATGREAVPLQPRYYPEDGSRLYLRGYYPLAEPGSNGVVYHLDGSQDVLISNEQSGSLTDMFWQESKRFTFNHLLTQLNIRVRVEEDYPEGARLMRMQIEGSHRDMLLDLNKGTLLAIGEPEPLTVWEGDRSGALLSTTYPDTLTAITMLEAGVALTFSATVILPGGGNLYYNSLPIRFLEADGLPRAGTSYTLSVTLEAEKEKLSFSAVVTDWTEKEGGEMGI